VIPQNTFSGNKGYGVVIAGRAHDNTVDPSFIGTQILGVKALGNKKGGVLITDHAYSNLIGQEACRRPNVISGNTGIGVTLTGDTMQNSVINNYIGLNRFGRLLSNSGGSIVNSGRRNTISGNNQTQACRAAAYVPVTG
jgi:hypothetical protein